jgi:hypothetical protein
MYLQRGVKDRFDSAKRQAEAEQDRDLNNTRMLEMLLDNWDDRKDDVEDGGRDE